MIFYSAWKFTKPNPAMKQRFQAQISVHLYPFDTDLELFTPLNPQVFEPMSRDALYPFDRETRNEAAPAANTGTTTN